MGVQSGTRSAERVSRSAQRPVERSQAERSNHKHRIDAIQAFNKVLGESKISAHYINKKRQTSRVRVAGERANLHTHHQQLRNDIASNTVEDAIHGIGSLTTIRRKITEIAVTDTRASASDLYIRNRGARVSERFR